MLATYPVRAFGQIDNTDDSLWWQTCGAHGQGDHVIDGLVGNKRQSTSKTPTTPAAKAEVEAEVEAEKEAADEKKVQERFDVFGKSILDAVKVTTDNVLAQSQTTNKQLQTVLCSQRMLCFT